MSEALEKLLGPKRDAAVIVIGAFLVRYAAFRAAYVKGTDGKDTPEIKAILAEVKRASRVTKALNQSAQDAGNIPGEALDWLTSTIWTRPDWIEFVKARKFVWEHSETGRALARKRAKTYYDKTGYDDRKTPEAREKLAAQARARRATKKAQAAAEVTP